VLKAFLIFKVWIGVTTFPILRSLPSLIVTWRNFKTILS
jgi:hypothetical protein